MPRWAEILLELLDECLVHFCKLVAHVVELELLPCWSIAVVRLLLTNSLDRFFCGVDHLTESACCSVVFMCTVVLSHKNQLPTFQTNLSHAGVGMITKGPKKVDMVFELD